MIVLDIESSLRYLGIFTTLILNEKYYSSVHANSKNHFVHPAYYLFGEGSSLKEII